MPDTAPTAADPDPPTIDLTGRTVGDFQVLRKLGQGGMGQVYLARQLSLKREVALKILRDDLAANPTALKRFQAEAEAVARVNHANIVQVYAVGEHEGLRYMALEFVDGRNLKDYLARKGPPELPIALAIMRQIAAALLRASELGLVHRDIKPENILVTRKSEVKVADFGLSRYFAGEEQAVHLTQSGMTLGTPLYMSPEQVQGHVVDHRSDIYSFGVTCYHLLAGHPPFRGNTPFEVAIQHVQTEPPPLAAIRPDLPPDLCAMIHKMMAKRAEDRYQTARDIIRDLAKLQKGLSLGLPVPSGGAGPSGSVPVLLPATGSAPVVPSVHSANRWLPRFGLALGILALTAIGWFTFPWMNFGTLGSSANTVGLPDARLSEPIISARERELLGTLASRQAKSPDVLNAAIELGLLYVRERRWDDADKVFKELEQERLDRPIGPKLLAGPAFIPGRLGQGIVLAHRDLPKESNELFEKTLYNTPRASLLIVNRFLVDHPDFAEAVAEALNRNMDNLNLDKLPDRLEWLRTPSGVIRGPRN